MTQPKPAPRPSGTAPRQSPRATPKEPVRANVARPEHRFELGGGKVVLTLSPSGRATLTLRKPGLTLAVRLSALEASSLGHDLRCVAGVMGGEDAWWPGDEALRAYRQRTGKPDELRDLDRAECQPPADGPPMRKRRGRP